MKRVQVPTLILPLIAGLALTGAGSALAAGTPSGTTISNTATVDYTVGGIGQTQITSAAATFVVDNKVDMTVATSDVAIVVVIPGATDQIQTFSVTNNGNTVQDYSLTAPNSATGAFGETETFDAGNVRIYVDANGNDAYDSGTDTGTYIDELAPDSSVTVFVLADVALSQVDGDVSSFDLVAQVAAGGTASSQGADITSDDSGTADDPDSVDIVFADAAGTGSGDVAGDGIHSSKDGYKVQTATISVAKSSQVTNDPINGGTNPKAIPGATVDYTVDVDNTGSTGATNVIVADAIPANTAFLVGSVTTTPASGPTVEYSDDSGSTWTYTPVAGGDGSDPGVTDVRVTFASVASSASVQAVFQVLIQ